MKTRDQVVKETAAAIHGAVATLVEGHATMVTTIDIDGVSAGSVAAPCWEAIVTLRELVDRLIATCLATEVP